MHRTRHCLSLVLLLAASLLLPLHEGEARPGGGNTFRRNSSSSSRSSSSSSSSRSSSSSTRSSSSSSSRSSSSSSRSSSSRSSSSRSYSSSSSSSSSSGASEPMDPMVVTILLWLCGGFGFVLVGGYLFGWLTSRGKANWKVAPQPSSGPPQPQRRVPHWELLMRLTTAGPAGPDGKPVPFDPDFSLVLFEDFLYALYAQAHELRGGDRLDTLAAYLSPPARQTLRSLGTPAQVKAVVVGAMSYQHVTKIKASSTDVRVRVLFESNYTEVQGPGAEQSWYAAEEWTLVRSTRAKSRPPGKTRIFKCPNCGAPLEGMRGSTCSYCEQKVDTGAFDWVVEQVQLHERQGRGPQLTGNTEEEGTSGPTIYQPGYQQALARLKQEATDYSQQALWKHVGDIFQVLQQAWSAGPWELARPVLSDSFFQMQAYWLQVYRESGLRNMTENARITRIEPVRVISDRHYHALTVRLHATGLDYTVRVADGEVVGGSKTQERAYSEYWTLIRSRAVSSQKQKSCTSCGAPLSLNMAGQCTHCSAKVMSDEFSWVLSRIEQDEAYQG